MSKRHPHAALSNAESNKFFKSPNLQSFPNRNFIAGPNQAALETSQESPTLTVAPQELAIATGEPREVTQQASSFRGTIPAVQTNFPAMEISTHPSLDNSADQTGTNAHAEIFPSTNGPCEHNQDSSANLPHFNNQQLINNPAQQLGIIAHAETFPNNVGLGEQQQVPSANLLLQPNTQQPTENSTEPGINEHTETFPINGLGEHVQDPSANIPQFNNQQFIDSPANQFGINAHVETFPSTNGLSEHHQIPSANSEPLTKPANSQNHSSAEDKMVLINIHPSDHHDKWHSFTAVLPVQFSHPTIHLHAHTMMDQISEPAIHRDIDPATTSVTAIPSTPISPAILIWQLHPPTIEEPKAMESRNASRSPDPLHTHCHVDTPHPHHTDTHTSDPHHSLLHELLEPSASTHECMYVYDRAAQYDLQTAIQGTTKRHMINIERRTLRSIQDTIANIILQTCLGDPRDDPESVYLPHDPHTSAIYLYVRDLCRPLQAQHDLDCAPFLHSIVQLTHDQLNPLHLHAHTINDPDMNSYHPTARLYTQSIQRIISEHQKQMTTVFTSFVTTYITSQRSHYHTDFFSVSPMGHIRYHPNSRTDHFLRPRTMDEIQDISPNFFTLKEYIANIISQQCHLLTTEISHTVARHLRRWILDLDHLSEHHGIPIPVPPSSISSPDSPPSPYTQGPSSCVTPTRTSPPKPTPIPNPPEPRTLTFPPPAQPLGPPPMAAPKPKGTNKKPPQNRSLVPLNLVTPMPSSPQVLPPGHTPLAVSFPLPDNTNIHTSPGLEILQYMTYHLTGSTIFFAEGFPLDITDPELDNFLYFMEEQLQIGVDHNRTRFNIRQQINQNTTITRLPNNLFGTIIYMTSDAATYTYGFHHGYQQRLAFRIIPLTYQRSYASNNTRQAGYLTTYISVHPIPDMGAHTAEIAADQGSTPLALARMIDQIPGNRSGSYNSSIPNIQAKLNATFLLLHRFSHRWFPGRDFFLQLTRTPANYDSSPTPLVETILIIRVPRERTVSAGRPTYTINAAGLAEMRRAIGFGPQKQQRSIQIQSDLIELLDPVLRDAMRNSPPLLPHREHGHPRPFWLLSNIDPDITLSQVLELLATYDAELADLTLAQGSTAPPPAIMDMINIIATAPAELLPILPNRPNGRPPPPRTTSYLLLPRAGAIMVDPPPLMACLTQAGPFRTSARFEIRRDGFFMEDLRNLARSSRGTEAPFAHPSIVTTAEYTT